MCRFVVLIAYLLWIPLSLSLFEESNFSRLISSDEIYDSNIDIAAVEAALWDKYMAEAAADSDRVAEHSRRELHYQDKTMKFSLTKKGERQGKGYPVYIALHGGGGAPAYVNDSQWEHMKVYYLDSVNNGIYVATRGITNTWDLHFQPESYPLYDRLIENLIAYEGADPNRIYLLGFSAGGDGVYQIVPRMPDRFAAANMSAGHHNWIPFDNLFNTPFLLQVGELDGAYNRARVAAENFLTLEGLRTRHQGYVSDIFIHQSFGHNGWYDNDANNGLHNVISNPRAWLETGDRSVTKKNTTAVTWLNRYERQNLPKKIIWDLGTNAPRSKTWGASYVEEEGAISDAANLFYWLSVDETKTSGRIVAEINSADNSIVIKEAAGIDKIRVLLHRSLIDFSRPVKIYQNDQKLLEIEPKLRLSTMAKSLLARGDKAFVFHDEVVVALPHGLSLASAASSSASTFTYCSDGHCRLSSAIEFEHARGFPTDLHYACKADHHYALTFDDGPSSNWPAVLEILARHNAKATFFVVGGNLASEYGKAMVTEAYRAGHQIANHTFSHRSLIDISDDDVVSEVMNTQDAILAILGDNEDVRGQSSIVRPPYGNINKNVQRLLQVHGFTAVRWNSDRYDWKIAPDNSDVIKDRLNQHLEFLHALPREKANRSILDVNHDNRGATLAALDDMLTIIKTEGYEFVTVKECLGL